ncbi:MAG: M23 family metallopeptidase [Alteripontixanthobacter sp.]
MNLVDRILTIVITATLTSAIWIVAGGSLIELADSDSQRETTRPAEAAPSPDAAELTEGDVAGTPELSGDALEEAVAQEQQAAEEAVLDTESATGPTSGETRNLLIPVLNVRPRDLTDTFADSRKEGERMHEAIDIMAPDGTSVVAAAPGVIEKLFVSKAGGNTIYVRSQDKQTIHYYAHLGEYAKGLKEGQRIRRGQRLGTVGSSGNASREAPHLHFAILRTTADAAWWEPTNAVNPYPLLTNKR